MVVFSEDGKAGRVWREEGKDLGRGKGETGKRVVGRKEKVTGGVQEVVALKSSEWWGFESRNSSVSGSLPSLPSTTHFEAQPPLHTLTMSQPVSASTTEAVKKVRSLSYHLHLSSPFADLSLPPHTGREGGSGCNRCRSAQHRPCASFEAALSRSRRV